MSIFNNRNIVIGLLGMLGGLLYGYFGKAYLADIPLVTAQSSLYTQSLAWCMGACGLVTLIMGIREVRVGKAEETKKSSVGEKRQETMLLLAIIAATIAAIFLMPRMGFMFTSALVAIVYMYLMHERRWKQMISIAIILCSVLYLMFGYALRIQFPEFPLFF
ncbi:MAG: tripartite tricarboxylate transporter TctB family protein [Zoogloeaceae bacterium]|jgi:cadmium resistance protein CadD (predicted permease)|nr:tripartite tricarboxylate transporter TctB family protein [Zoogloeaceae bacterium]